MAKYNEGDETTEEKAREASAAFDRLREGGKSLAESLRGVGKAIQEIVVAAGTQLGGVFDKLVDQVKKVTGVFGAGSGGGDGSGLIGAAGAGSKALGALGKASNIVIDIFASVFVSAISKVSGALSGLLAPNVEAITGGLAKMDEASTRVGVAVRDMALEIERGQQSVLEPFKEKLADIVERLLAFSPATLRSGAAIGEVLSLLSTGVSKFLAWSAALLGFGAILAGALAASTTLATFLGITFVGSVDALIKVLLTLTRVSFGALLTTLGALWAALSPFLPLILGVAAIVAAGAAGWAYYTKKTDEAGNSAGTLRQRLDELAEHGSEKAKRMAEAFGIMADEINLSAEAMQTAREADEALGKGDAFGAAQAQKRLAAMQQELDLRRQHKQLVEQIMDVEGRSRTEAEKEATSLMAKEQVEKAITAQISARLQLEEHEREVLRFNLEIEQKKLDVVQDSLKVAMTESETRSQTAQEQLELAKSRGNTSEILDAQKTITEEYLKQKQLRLDSLEIQKRENAAAVTEGQAEISSLQQKISAVKAQQNEGDKEQIILQKKILDLTDQRGKAEEDAGNALANRTNPGWEKAYQTAQALSAELGKQITQRTEEIAAAQQVGGVTKEEEQTLKRLEAEQGKRIVLQRQLTAESEKELKNHALLVQLEQQLINLKRQEFQLRQNAEDAQDRLTDLRNSRYGEPAPGSGAAADVRRRYENRFTDSKAQLDKLSGDNSTLGLEQRQQLVGRLEKLIAQANDAGSTQIGDREIENLAKASKLIADAQLKNNQTEQGGLKQQIDEATKSLDAMATPAEKIAGSIARMKDGFKDVVPLINAATVALDPYEKKLQSIADLVATIPGGAGVAAAMGGTVSVTPEGTNITPGSTTTTGGGAAGGGGGGSWSAPGGLPAPGSNSSPNSIITSPFGG